MTKKKLAEILRFGPWVEEEAPASFYLIDHCKTCYIDTVYAHKKKFYRTCIYLVDHQYAYEWTPQKDSEVILCWLLKNLKKDSKFLIKKDRYFAQLYKETQIFSDVLQKKDLAYISNDQLLRLFNKASFLLKKQYGYSMITEAGDVLTEKDFRQMFPNVPSQSLLEVVRALSVPARRTYLDDFNLVLNEAALALKKCHRIFPVHFSMIKDRGLRRKLQNIRDKYYWIDNSFKIADVLCTEDIYAKVRKRAKEASLTELKEERDRLMSKPIQIRREQKGIYSRYQIGQKGRILVQLLQYLSLLQDRRKEPVLRFGSNIRKIYDAIQHKTGISRKELDFYLIEDIRRLLKEDRRVSKKELQKRHVIISIGYYKGKNTASEYFVGRDAKKIFQYFMDKRKKEQGKELKGFVASLGNQGSVVKGKVRIILDPDNGDLKKGEILVTGMTRPEFVPLMKKAKAVITNEGGITTHAAIVSRELKIPCIIGTKYATDKLHTGQVIEMDMQKGIIKICHTS